MGTLLFLIEIIFHKKLIILHTCLNIKENGLMNAECDVSTTLRSLIGFMILNWV